MGAQLRGFQNAKEGTGETGVIEVELRCLDGTRFQVGVKRPQAKDQEGGLQCREPRLCRIRRDAGVCAELREVRQLPHPAGSQLQKRLKGTEVSNVHDLTDIAFEGCGDVAPIPVKRVDIAIEDGRVRAGLQGAEQRLRRVGELQ